MVDFEPKTATSGNMIGICPDCDSLMYRRVSFAKLSVACGNLEVRLPEEAEHIVDSH
jgi:hypothetical protein